MAKRKPKQKKAVPEPSAQPTPSPTLPCHPNQTGTPSPVNAMPDKRLLVYGVEAMIGILLILFFTIPAGGLKGIGDWTTFLAYAVGYSTLLWATHHYFEGHKLYGARILLAFGMMVSLFLTVHHVQLMNDPTTSFCQVSETVSCDIVNTSEYSESFGIPIAAFGFLIYVLIYFLLYIAEKHTDAESIMLSYAWIFSLSTIFFTLWLLYVSEVILGAWCPMCMLTYMVNIVVFLFINLHMRKKVTFYFSQIHDDLRGTTDDAMKSDTE